APPLSRAVRGQAVESPPPARNLSNPFRTGAEWAGLTREDFEVHRTFGRSDSGRRGRRRFEARRRAAATRSLPNLVEQVRGRSMTRRPERVRRMPGSPGEANGACIACGA